MKQNSQRFLQQRKFFMVLPLLSLPFVVMIFWSLGGGKGSEAAAAELPGHAGINMHLPGANLKEDEALNKMSFYDQAEADSVKSLEKIKSDPSYRTVPGAGAIIHDTSAGVAEHPQMLSTPSINGIAVTSYRYGIPVKDPNEEKVYSKLAQLNTALSHASQQAQVKDSYSNYVPAPSAGTMNSADIDRLEQMMHTIKGNSDPDDPEMEQLNGMMDKIMAIQHPERTTEKLRHTSLEHQSEAYPVAANVAIGNVSLFERIKKGNGGDTVIHDEEKGFYPVGSTAAKSSDQNANAIEAVIHETTSLVSGATLKLRLTTDVYISGVLIPKGSFIYGTADVREERLRIIISSIRYQHSIYPVKLSVYDLDGMEGIFIPGAITRDVAKSSADQAIQGIGISSLNTSIPMQAASAGLQAAKSLLSKKAKLVKVSVEAGYKVLLKDAGQ